MPRSKPVNPFYFLLIVVGIAFCITASAFGLMTLRQVRASQPLAVDDSGQPHPLLLLMDRHGMQIMLWEIGLLGVFTFAAIGTDQYWINQEARENEAKAGAAPPPADSESVSVSEEGSPVP